MEPTLMVVGLNYRTAPVAVRERFWIDESRRYDALTQLSSAEGIEEVIVLATCTRTEFWLWAGDVTLAANSVMRSLAASCGLKLCEWKHFYRLLDEAALLHVFRVASSLDSMVVGEPQVVTQVKEAWQHAQKAGATGRFLDAVLQKALGVSERVRTETAIANTAVSVPYAAVELARQIFGTLENKKVLVLGAGQLSELSARELIKQGANSTRVSVVNRTLEHAAELAAKLGGVAVPFEERRQQMAEADIIISSTSCPHTVLNRAEAEEMVRGRNMKQRPLVIVDIAMPRDIDAAVRTVEGISLFDFDDLESVADHNASEREAAAAEAQKILQAEAQGFRRKLVGEHVVPTIVALRLRLDEICGKELDTFRQENGPFSRDQNEMLDAVLARMTQKIAGSLARELKELPGKNEQEQLTTALQRLFHLKTPVGRPQSMADGKSA
ncbi:MAG: glutamyl-tRNA reductase [Terriglobales bacterium]